MRRFGSTILFPVDSKLTYSIRTSDEHMGNFLIVSDKMSSNHKPSSFGLRMIYCKLPLISPGLIQRKVFLKRKVLDRLITEQKSVSKQAIAVSIEIRFSFTGVELRFKTS